MSWSNFEGSSNQFSVVKLAGWFGLQECVITGFNYSSTILFLEDEDDINLMFSLNISTPDDGSVSKCRICKVSVIR
jgi:hypothetical protein